MTRLCGTVGLVLCGLLAAHLVSGCSNGGAAAGPLAPAATTSAIAGTVVDATNVTRGLVGAVITVQQTGASRTTATGGTFAIQDLPAGALTLAATFPGLTAQYQPVSVQVQTREDQTTSVVIAALPVSETPGDTITISPGSLKTDVGGRRSFAATIRRNGLAVGLAPSWYVIGGIGTVGAAGNFVATRAGTGQVTATTGTVAASAAVTVVASRPPELGTLQVSPSGLDSDGGTVRIAVTVADGNGVTGVTATIELPDSTTPTQALARESGTEYAGTWAGNYSAPANTSPTEPGGGQPAQTYSVRVTATDGSGESIESEWKSFTVAGLEAPPPQPF